jgi:hypothetical protein
MDNEENTAPSAEASAPEPVTMESALASLNAQDEPAAPEPTEVAPPEDQADPAEDVSSDDTPDALPDAEAEEPEVLHGNARTRLRDGSVVTVGELKKAYDEAKEYRVKQAEIDARARETEAKLAHIAQTEQQTARIIQQAKAVLQARFSPRPDYGAVERGEIDILTYTEQKEKWERDAREWQQLNQAEQAAAQKAQEETAKAQKAQFDAEVESFLTRFPEHRPAEKQQAFKQDLVRLATETYGAKPEQLGDIKHAWQLEMAQDAMRYRKLQAEKSKVLEKVKDAPPVQVQTPGRRVSPAEKQAQERSQLFAQARARGGISREEALALMQSID